MTLTPGDFLTNNDFPLQCLDLVDLPDAYNVLIAENGARHAVLQTPDIYMGTQVDIEGDGQPDIKAGELGGGDDGADAMADDEDASEMKPIFIITVPTTQEIPVVNPTTSTVTLYAFLNLNANNSLDDAGEKVKAIVAAGFSGTVNLTITPPATAEVGVDLGFRLRISSDRTLTSSGFAENSEVEDYMALIAGFDYGDLP